ncbi:hypothetical protein D3C75_1312100 [compost metagenome]
MSSWVGIMMVATTAKNPNERPGNFSRANPYPASEQSTRCDATPTPDTMIVLSVHRRMSDSWNSRVNPSSVRCDGKNRGG